LRFSTFSAPLRSICFRFIRPPAFACEASFYQKRDIHRGGNADLAKGHGFAREIRAAAIVLNCILHPIHIHAAAMPTPSVARPAKVTTVFLGVDADRFPTFNIIWNCAC